MDKKQIKIGKIELEIPNYMVVLDQSIIDEIFQSSEIGIIAAGLHPDGKVTFITSKGDIRIFDPNEFFIPPGHYIPTPGGSEVYLPSNENRWPGYSNGFYVKSNWLIQNSVSEMGSATLQINNRYVSDIDIKSLETIDT